MNRRTAPLFTLCLIILPYLAYVIYMWHRVPFYDATAVGPGDPDIWLRLTMVREWITSGDWYNHVIPNYNLPFGSINQWTRPVDLVVRALVWCMPDAALNDRLIHAAMIMPLIWLTLLLLGVFRIVRLFSDIPDSIFMSGVMLAAMPATRNYFGLGNADHHAPLAVLFIWVLSIVIRPASSRGHSILAGLMLALMLWICVEGISLIAVVYGWFGLLWLKGEYERASALRPIAISCFFGSVFALLVEFPPSHWLVPAYDIHSIVYVVVLFFAALIATLMPFASRLPKRAGYLMVVISSLVSLVTIVYCFPDILKGPLAQATDFSRNTFMSNISEAQPIFERPLTLQLAMLLYPILLILVSIAPRVRPNLSYYRRDEALPIFYFCTILTIMLCAQIRWNYYVYPLVIAALSPLYGALFKADDNSLINRWPANVFRVLPEKKQALIRMTVILFSVALPIGLYLVPTENTYTKEGVLDETTNLKKLQENCMQNSAVLIRSGQLTKLLGTDPKTILVGTNLGIEIIFFTPHRVIASNYHRDGDAIEYVWNTFALRDEKTLRTKLNSRHIDAIINCPDDPKKLGLLYDYQIGRARLPSWLEPIAYTLPKPQEKDQDAEKDANEAKFDLLPQLLLVRPVAK